MSLSMMVSWLDMIFIVLVFLAYRAGVRRGIKQGRKEAEVQRYRDRLVAVERQINTSL